MKFIGITKDFDLFNEAQYETIGQFWDDMAEIYGLENLRGLGHRWQNGMILYAIGLKEGIIDGYNFTIELPDDGWTRVLGRTDDLKEIYDEIIDSALPVIVEMKKVCDTYAKNEFFDF